LGLLMGLLMGLVMGIVTATGASADVVSGGTLTNGTAVTATIAVPSRDVQYQFTGTNGLHSTIDVTASDWGSGSAQVEIVQPNGTLYTYCTMSAAPTFCEFTPNISGSWGLRIDPVGPATGSATFTFGTDQAKGKLASGTPITTTIAIKGQDAHYTFAATGGLPVTFNATASSWGTGAARLYFFPPAGGLYDWCNLGNTPTTCTIYPNVTGDWNVTLDPLDNSVGSTTFAYASDLDRGPITLGTPITTAITVPNQNARYTFAGTAGTHLSLDVTASTWGTGGAANLYVFMPDGTLYLNCPLAGRPTYCDFTPNVTGTWKLTLDPTGAAVGSTTFTLVADQAKGALAVGGSIATTIGAKGQNATFTIPVTIATVVKLHITGATFGTGNARLYFYGPNTSSLYDHCDLNSGTTDCNLYPNATGTWRMTLDPLGSATGSATIQRT
jgi:hypothetical protein